MEYEIPRADLDAMVATVARYGVTVGEDWNEPEGARFIGTFEGTHITLFPKFDTNFALYFTVAHLYGHMTQLQRQAESTGRVNQLISRQGPLTHDEIQAIYQHEYEAAAIALKLIADELPTHLVHAAQLTRLFWADFHYLIHFLETGEGGPAAFSRFWRRQPVAHEVITPDPRPLLQLSKVAIAQAKVVVV